MIDNKSKILFEYLLVNARSSVKKLAQMIHSSEATVVNRIRKLETDGYISRYDAIINWQKMPFIKKVYFIKVDTESKKFEGKMLKQKSVFSIIKLDGLYNYQVWCFFKTKKQLSQFNKEINDHQIIDIEINELIFPKVTFFDVPIKLHIQNMRRDNSKLGKIDIAIMKYMAQGHGRDSLYEISKAIKIPYDSVHYHGKKLLGSDYFTAIIAQPGTNKLTLQITSLLIECTDKDNAHKLFDNLKNIQRVQSNAIGEENKVLVHFLSQEHIEYRETFSNILSIIPRVNIKNILTTYWKNVVLNNKYPLEYFLES